MKTTMEYMVGNTAIQIVNTGKKIKVIDVKKEKLKKRTIKRFCAGALLVFAMIWSCFYVVKLQNTKTMLDENIFLLQGQIESLESKNILLEKEYDNEAIDYGEIMKKAKALGMKFPSPGQICHYHAKKSTAVRIKKEAPQ